MAPITVIIPVGPQPEYLQWLPEAVQSVLAQTLLPDEILLVGDGTHLPVDNLCSAVGLSYWDIERELDGVLRYRLSENRELNLNVWQTPWNIGFSPVFNCGVGLAENNLILYLAADDRLLPTAVEDCLHTWAANNRKDAWYALSYQVGAEVHTIPNNAAMITRNLWKWMGGFPPAAFAGPDALMLSRLMVHAPDRIIKVAEGKPNYWIREHAAQETKRQFSFYAASGIMEVIRNKETERFIPNPEIQLK